MGRPRRRIWHLAYHRPPDPATELDSGSEDPHLADAIRTAIAQLPFRRRAAIVLRYYHECTYVERADVLELSVSAAEPLAEENATLMDLMVPANPDRRAIAARLDKLAELHRRRQQQGVEHFLRLSELLDDDQRKQYEEAIGGVLARVGIGHPHARRHHGSKEDDGVPRIRCNSSV